MKHALAASLFLLMILLISNGAASLNRALASTEPIIYVESGTYEASKIGENVLILIRVAYIMNFTGFQLKVKFNNTVLQCLSVSMGKIFPSQYNPLPKIRINNTEGEIYIQSHAGDLDNNGMVSLTDLVILANAYGSRQGDEGWNPNADIDGNGKVGLTDLVILSKNYRKLYPINAGPVGITILEITFNATYGSPYPYKETSSIEIFDSVLYSGIPPKPTTHTIQNGTYKTPCAPPELELTLNTDKESYCFDEKINITGTLCGNGSPIPDALITLQIEDATNHTVALRTLPTSSLTITCPIKVIGLYPCDGNGIPQYIFPIGTSAHFNITVKNDSPSGLHALIYVNLYDSSNASIGVSYLETTLNAGSVTQIILGIPIQNATTSGYAVAYAGVLTDYPKNGGTALSMEKNAVFNITGSQEGNPIFMKPLPQGNYGTVLSFHFIGQASGNFTIYATTTFMGKNAAQTKQILITQS